MSDLDLTEEDQEYSLTKEDMKNILKHLKTIPITKEEMDKISKNMLGDKHKESSFSQDIHLSISRDDNPNEPITEFLKAISKAKKENRDE